MPGWVAPWQNAGEGILPDFSRGDDYGMQDLMTSYRWDAFERMSTEAQDNAADWIKRTSGYDPNLVISQGKKVNMDTSGRSILDSTDSYEDAAAKLARAQAASGATGFPDAVVDKPDVVKPDEDKPDEVVKPEPVEAETWEEMMQEDEEQEEDQAEEDEDQAQEDDEPNYHQQWAEKRAREELERQMHLDAKRLRHEYWVEQNRLFLEDKALHGEKGKKGGKADKAWQMERWDWELEKNLWAWDEDVPDPYANSHVPDPVPDNMHGISVPMHESIVHEEQTFVPMTPAFEAAIAALEAGPQRPSSMQLTGTVADPATAWSGPMPTYQGPSPGQVAGQNVRDWYTRAKMEASAQGLLGGMGSTILGVVPQSLGGNLGVDPTPVKTI